MKRKDDMSETTSETGHAEIADEPSMEDILASIRKIIADDDQTMDLSEPQALETPSAFGEDITTSVPSLTPASLIEETVSPEPSAFDENSVFNNLNVGDLTESEASIETPDLSGDVMDLDIAALLGEADNQVQNETPLMNEATQFSEEDEALFEAIDLEIPDVPEAAEVQENQSVEAVSSLVNDDVIDDSIFDLTEAIETPSEASIVSDETVASDDDDSLFDELEGLLADVPEEPVVAENIVIETVSGDTLEAPENDSDNILESTLMTEDLTTNNVVISETIDDTFLQEDESIDSLLSEFTDGLVIENEDTLTHAETLSVKTDETPAFSTDGNDLPLVKSLMEDLTEPETDLDPEIEIAESQEDVALALSGTDALEIDTQEDGDILDDILNMSLDSELESHEDDLAIPEPEMTVEPTAETVAVDEVENIVENETSSLMDIAAAAEQEAEALEGGASLAGEPAIIEGPAEEAESDLGLETGLTAGVLGAAAIVAAKAAENKRQDEAEIVEPETSIETHQSIETQEETADMPRAIKSETILDDVTETATADVFASLNQVVEEKAIKAERGDRIGDLVMEALRPMLKEWLDANLKGIVERAVAKEVKRISTGK